MKQKQLTPHFSVAELTYSSLALRHGISNDPGPQALINLNRVAAYILEPVRQNFKIGFSPSSGFRASEINRLAGSHSKSQHVTGHAVDFEIPGIANRVLADWIKANLTFDQLILEFHQPDVPSSGWVHCSYHTDHNRNECLIFDGTSFRKF